MWIQKVYWPLKTPYNTSPQFTHTHTLMPCLSHWIYFHRRLWLFNNEDSQDPTLPQNAFGSTFCGFHVAYWNKCNSEAHLGFMQREQWVLTVLQYKGYFWVHLCESLWDCISSVGFFFRAALLSLSWSYITGNIILRALKSYNFNAAYFTT